ncbi:adenosylcobinamide-GDP ribazoletransferase [Paenibacillus spongiae]|uniref:Adenosylcobinamide-GDP ribazoletransferase n=1 Tax=Paenibacillus spongiae TaxID=2909671 RepID=A0ABY5SF38_9BACL|nr:adenosylcobinamide-GDP ribazoletransferase [Paenibacillus spongiae]UVI32602.1 adenosylcobinamide-GDP ribazoletransferase [Paenibacillus spongiae]
MAIRALTGLLQAVGSAFQLLTRIPVPVNIPFTPQVLARSTVCYPVVGLVIGGITASSGWLLESYVPAMPAAVIILLLWVALSGALHLDGLMDTADGVLSHRSRERMLEIMKDSRVGAMGVIAAAGLLLFKFAVLSELLLTDGFHHGAVPLLTAACVWSRTWMIAAIAIWPQARKNEGLGALFAGVTTKHLASGTMLHAIILVALFKLYGYSWTVTGLLLGGGAAITLVTGLIMAIWLSRKLGGLTGDTYGAMNEVLECMLLFAAMMWI